MRATRFHFIVLNAAVVALAGAGNLLADGPTSQPAAATPAAPTPTPRPPPPLPPIVPVRYTEDYSAAPTSLKHIPLGHSGDWYLTLGNELRLRYESYQDNQWGQGPQDSGGYLWARVMPYADLHVGEHFRAFGQIVAAFEWWDDAGIRPPDEDRLDVLQAISTT